MSDLVFDKSELQELATAPGDRAVAALDRGDLAGAREIAAASVICTSPPAISTRCGTR